MSYESSNAAIGLFGESNVIIEDKNGYPSVMVRIPKLRMADLIDGGSYNVHPAFLVQGEEVDEIYISKFPNCLIDGYPCSIPLESPATEINYDEAKEYCESKGDGWHLMTNAEYSLLALIAKKYDSLPYGNNNGGKNIETGETGINSQWDLTTLAGSGTVRWSHNNDRSGIFDLCGNVNEWIAGLRLMDGQIQLLIDNNAAVTGLNSGKNSTLWKTLNTDGTYGDLEEIENTYFYDYRDTPKNGGAIVLRDHRYEKQSTDNMVGESTYKSLATNGPGERLVAHGLAPKDKGNLREDTVRIKNTGERIARRGGCYSDKEKAGINHLNLCSTRAYKGMDTGFRACYVKP